MLSLPPAVRVFLCLQPADMRCSFDSLSQMAQVVTQQDPFSGHLFVFRGKRGDRAKILYWDRDGYALWYKRLEKGVFRFPKSDQGSAEIESAELAMLLEGIDFTQVKRSPRYRKN
jgi:transposase